jgi:pilus assembly protein CpaF
MDDQKNSPLLDSEEYYHKIREFIFRYLSPADILREKSKAGSQIKNEIRTLALRAVQESKRIIPMEYQEQLIQRLLNEIFGFGIIQPLLEDEDVAEIMIVSPDQVYIERSGKLILADYRFDNEAQILQIIDRIVSPLGRRIDESSPLVDARLPDGSRINAVIPPIAVKSPTLTIRKFKTSILEYQSLIKLGSMNSMIAEFLDICVHARMNILISGGTGSGKTTLLNVCSSSIPADERIITIEDSIELQLLQPHVVSLEGRPANIEGQGKITIRDLVINALRMRPDRIVVGEVRGPEAFDMLQAMNTGHDGSLSTIHSNSPKDAVSRLIAMVYMAGIDMPVHVIREMIFGAVEIVVQTSRLPDGSRKIIAVTSLDKFEGEEIRLHDIFQFVWSDQSTDDGKIVGRYQFNGIGERLDQKIRRSMRNNPLAKAFIEKNDLLLKKEGQG